MKKKCAHILDLQHVSKEWILALLSRAKTIQNQLEQQVWKPSCVGKKVVSLFFEPSTRTRVSFEMALHNLGAIPIPFDVQGSSEKKGENLRDMLRNLEALGAEAFVVRHPQSGAAKFIADMVSVPVINAGDGMHEHPTQALLDVMVLQSYLGQDLSQKKILICGDILHSRVAHSNLWALKKLGADVFVTGPDHLIPNYLDVYEAQYVPCLDDILPQLDAINVLRVQLERHQTQGVAPLQPSVYRKQFGLTSQRLALCKKSLIVLHPGPLNRGVEIDSDVADGPQSVILEQVKAGVSVRMACLEYGLC